MNKLKLSLTALLLIAGINMTEAKIGGATSTVKRASISSTRMASPLSIWNMVSKDGKKIGKIEESQIKGLSPEVISAIPANQIKKFSKKQIKSLSKDQIASLSGDQLTAILNKMETRDIKVGAGRRRGRVERRRGLTKSQFKFLTSDQLTAIAGQLSEKQRHALTDKQREILSAKKALKKMKSSSSL